MYTLVLLLMFEEERQHPLSSFHCKSSSVGKKGWEERLREEGRKSRRGEKTRKEGGEDRWRQMGKKTSAERHTERGNWKDKERRGDTLSEEKEAYCRRSSWHSRVSFWDVMISQILLINDTFTLVPALLLNTNWSILQQIGRCCFPLHCKQCELTRGHMWVHTHKHTRTRAKRCLHVHTINV